MSVELETQGLERPAPIRSRPEVPLSRRLQEPYGVPETGGLIVQDVVIRERECVEQVENVIVSGRGLQVDVLVGTTLRRVGQGAFEIGDIAVSRSRQSPDIRIHRELARVEVVQADITEDVDTHRQKTGRLEARSIAYSCTSLRGNRTETVRGQISIS